MNEDRSWEARGLCGAAPEMWYTDSIAEKAIHQCLVHCPVLKECQDKALKEHPAWGVWGGLAWTPSNHNNYRVGQPTMWHTFIPTCSTCIEKAARLGVERICSFCGEPIYAKKKTGKPYHLKCRTEYSEMVRYIRWITQKHINPRSKKAPRKRAA